MFSIHIQKTKTGKHRVLILSEANDKLVLAGEALNNKKDAADLQDAILGQWNSRSTFHNLRIGSPLKPDHKFPRNYGPKKKK